MPFCPVDRDEFRAGMTWCPEHNVALVDSLPSDQPAEDGPISDPDEQPDEMRELGIYDRFVAGVAIDLLKENDIDAKEADTPEGAFTRRTHAKSTIILVPWFDLDEARTIMNDQLPTRLKELEEATEHDPSFGEESDDVQDPQPTPWGFSESQDEDGVEEYEAIPIGFMEPAVARVFIELCEEVDIGADTEYPLDEPPPAFARADGRVRVHVEEVLVDHAMRLLKEDLPGELARRAITYTEPLLEPED